MLVPKLTNTTLLVPKLTFLCSGINNFNAFSSGTGSVCTRTDNFNPVSSGTGSACAGIDNLTLLVSELTAHAPELTALN